METRENELHKPIAIHDSATGLNAYCAVCGERVAEIGIYNIPNCTDDDAIFLVAPNYCPNCGARLKKARKMTNREWLESLSDEELAKELDKDCKHFCKRIDTSAKCYKGYKCCVENRVRWLKAEHKDED